MSGREGEPAQRDWDRRLLQTGRAAWCSVAGATERLASIGSSAGEVK